MNLVQMSRSLRAFLSIEIYASSPRENTET